MHSNKNYSTIYDYLGLCHTYAAVLFAFWFTSDSAKKLRSMMIIMIQTLKLSFKF